VDIFTRNCYANHQWWAFTKVEDLLMLRKTMDIDPNAVLDWNGRPKRARRPPPRTYWEEYVATDEWYLNELLADVPEEERHAALEDEDWCDGEGEEGDDSSANTESDDLSYSSDTETSVSDGSSCSSEGTVDAEQLDSQPDDGGATGPDDPPSDDSAGKGL
jgi:hypothetical protein